MFFGRRGQPPPKDGGALTPLVYAVRANDLRDLGLEAVDLVAPRERHERGEDVERDEGRTPAHVLARGADFVRLKSLARNRPLSSIGRASDS